MQSSHYLLGMQMPVQQLREIEQAILLILHTASHPLGWYGIDQRLGRRGVISQENLVVLLQVLVQQGLIVHKERSGYPHGIYELTDLGRTYV
jgi:DNA-binding PadR family transcriptional regulator